MIESLIKRYDNENNNDLNNYIEGLNLNGLVNFYLKCSNHLYFQKYSNIGNILELILNNIKNKLSTVSIIELIDIYTNIFIETLNIEDSIDSNQNIIAVRKSNLEDEFFIEYESKRQKIDSKEFIDSYTKSLDYYEQNALYLKSVFSYIDNLQNYIMNYLDSVISKLSSEENRALLIKINEIIEKNSLEIIEKNEIRKNKKSIDIQSKMRELPTFEIFSMFDTTNLKHKNYIYGNFQAALKKQNYSNKK